MDNLFRKLFWPFMIVISYLILLSCVSWAEKNVIKLNGRIESVQIISWESKDVFFRLEDKLVDNNYHPMLKIVFSSPVDLVSLSNSGMNQWCEASMKENKLNVKVQCRGIFQEKIGGRKENNISSKNFLYSVLLYLEWPSSYKSTKTPEYLLDNTNTYNLLTTNKAVSIDIKGAKPFTHIELIPHTFIIQNDQIKDAIVKARSNGQLREKQQ
ncbi:MAG: hypothetical protein OEZ58_23485 [Gammaproteobacteria bacterium]|nr:hypothetical protein [Gammaproteobacteria bacterium]